MLLFLDFDGVQHPAPPHNRDTGVMSCLERFDAVMCDFPRGGAQVGAGNPRTMTLPTMFACVACRHPSAPSVQSEILSLYVVVILDSLPLINKSAY